MLQKLQKLALLITSRMILTKKFIENHHYLRARCCSNYIKINCFVDVKVNFTFSC